MPRKVKGCKLCGGVKPKGSGVLYCADCSGQCPTHGLVRHTPTNGCKYCKAAYMRVYISSDPDRVVRNARRARAANYGLSLEDLEIYEAITACEVCGSSVGKMCIDHNHTTGEIRGVLCSPCNTALGHAGDNPVRLRALATYLEERGTY